MQNADARTMQSLFDEHAGLALSRQNDLGARIGDWAWEFDADQGSMTFRKAGFFGFGGKQIRSACQVLGTEAHASQTWLWAWANTQSDLPESILRASAGLRTRGEREGVRELTERKLSLDAWDGHRIAMIASGLTRCAGYYRGPYEGGALFVLLTSPELESPVERPALRYSTVLPELVQGFVVRDHRLAARGLARGLGMRVEEQGEQLVVRGGDGRLTLSFDELGRMSGIDAKLG